MEKTPVPSSEFMADGNVFALVGVARKYLRRAGRQDAAKEMSERVLAASSYDEALRVILEYVDLDGPIG